MRPEVATGRAAGAFVDQLARLGVGHVAFAPGSRSTPLVLAGAEHPGLRLWVHLDERSAAFFALGIAKATRRPAAVVSTSGTAAANFHPAVVEAEAARVPLLVLTADRPPELRGVGAPQTINQTRLFGSAVRWYAEAELGAGGEDGARLARHLAAQAVAAAVGAPRGPVHLNLPFREPLVPDLAALAEGFATPPGPALAPGRPAPEEAAVEELAERLGGAARGLLVCGPQDDPKLPAALAGLAAALDWPLVADPLSGLRCGAHDRSRVVAEADLLARDPALADRLRPELVLRFGATPTSKALLAFLDGAPGAFQVLVDGGQGWADPGRRAAMKLDADPARLAGTLAARLGDGACSGDGDWLTEWLGAAARCREAVAAELAALDEPFEGRVFHELAAALPDGALLFAGSSMPVRDLDAFFTGTDRDLQILANRGANGIDGVVSTALGAAAGTGRPLVLVLGDLSLCHDMNGLWAARRHGISATVVVLDNDGGGIFSFLPQRDLPAHFEELFGTPHGLDLAKVADLYGAEHCRFDDDRGIGEAVARDLERPGLRLLQVRTDRERNVALHRRLWERISKALARQEAL